ncbi:DUF29 domain-containing protein [Duganella sp.]|uniref:DUF29 domain-containing protein n=1 Tax=Duganella sp. TaxID=1904440 RepID=UPI0031DD2A99
MNTLYDEDVVAWAVQQVHLLRSGLWSQLDIDNIAEEIEDVGKSEKRELRHRLAILVEHLIKWKWQPRRRGSSWMTTIRIQRIDIEKLLLKVPSLRATLDKELADAVWRDAVVMAVKQADCKGLPDTSPWTLQQVLTNDFFAR